jgi:hypothetical protein
VPGGGNYVLTNGAGTNGYIHMQKKEVGLLTQTIKNYLKVYHIPKCKSLNHKIFRRKYKCKCL